MNGRRPNYRELNRLHTNSPSPKKSVKNFVISESAGLATEAAVTAIAGPVAGFVAGHAAKKAVSNKLSQTHSRHPSHRLPTPAPF